MAWRENFLLGEGTITGAVDFEGALTFAAGLTLGSGATLTTEGGAVDLESEAITLGTGTSDTITMAGLPTEDPESAGVLWNNENVVTVSA